MLSKKYDLFYKRSLMIKNSLTRQILYKVCCEFRRYCKN